MACLHFDIVTIFPGVFAGVVGESILGRARKAGLFDVHTTDLRDFTRDRHRSVDDRPYGGGPGMLLKPEPVFEAVESVLALGRAPESETRKIVLTPQGEPLKQETLRRLARASWIVLLCGHYEGFDERIFEGLDVEQISIGDYVLSGGEIPALAILDGVVRLLPGALGHPESVHHESFEGATLDYPQYTRPPEFRGLRVPDVLLSGNHEAIASWRRDQASRKTQEKRADLLEDRSGR
jgi:tRNA (guanine37-N1)-methyltransferase